MNDRDIEYIEALEKEVKRIRDAALKKVQLLHPEIQHVVDRRTIDDYCDKYWDYPGKWYYGSFRLPPGFKNADELINAIANDTIRYFRK